MLYAYNMTNDATNIYQFLNITKFLKEFFIKYLAKYCSFKKIIVFLHLLF